MRAGDDVPGWVAAGARLIGGCCRIGPDQIREVAAMLRGSDGRR
jgi:homocysteine S-methyltransferase